MLGLLNRRGILRKRESVSWHHLRRLEPISRVFGFDRGTPIDRRYIDDFISKNAKDITGATLEISELEYTQKYGFEVTQPGILHTNSENSEVTIVGDLTRKESLPESEIDCFICTQTLNFIYDFHAAIEGAYYLLKPGGVVLATVAGISQISRYDMDRWGDFWRFNSMSMHRAFAKIFGGQNVEVNAYGNVLAATALLQGISAEELSEEEIFHLDQDYQMIIGIRAVKY